MKNILAENLLRFAPKNLSESDKKNLRKLTEAEESYSINLLITDSYENATSGNPTIVQDDASYIFFDTITGGKKYAFETGKLVVERNFAGEFTLVAGIPGTLDENNKFTPGTKLMLYTFSGDPVNLPTDDQGNIIGGKSIGSEPVRNLVKYNGTTQNGKFNAAQITLAATKLARVSLKDLWPKVTNFINKMAEIQLSTLITDEDKNAIYQQYIAQGGNKAAGNFN